MISAHDLRTAKYDFASKYRNVPGFAGVGLTKKDGEPAIKCNMTYDITSSLPQTFMGVPIVFEVIGTVAASA